MKSVPALDIPEKLVIVLPAVVYDEAEKKGLLNGDYHWVRQERLPMRIDLDELLRNKP